MKRLILLILAMAIGTMLYGCARHVQKDWFAMGGSKSDATIKLAVTWNPNSEIPQLSSAQAMTLAASKCRTWGYDSAEPFGSVQEMCISMAYTGFGPICQIMQANMEFQCVGQASPAPSMPQGNPSPSK